VARKLAAAPRRHSPDVRMTLHRKSAIPWEQPPARPQLQTEPPLVPGRDEAREWAMEELSKQEYAAAQPSLLDKLWKDFLEWLRSLTLDGIDVNAGNALPLITVAAVVITAVAIVLARPRLNARRRGDGRNALDVDPSVSPDTYRKRAAAAAAAADWRTAVVERFRAMVRSAEDRAIIDPQPGRTADEVAMTLGSAFSSHAGQLQRTAAVFDAVRYGKASVGKQDYEDTAALDDSLAGLQPDFSGPALQTLSRPL
jgi:hypothetical protein